MRYLNELKKALGREPNFVELQAFGITWSEHCGYCHTKEYIKRLPGVKRELNAGVVELGNGYVVSFKIESTIIPVRWSLITALQRAWEG